MLPSLALVSVASCLTAQDVVSENPAPKELGAVAFGRDLDAVLRRKPAKPVFLLFQEIPG
jgi:hypothetical protein